MTTTNSNRPAPITIDRIGVVALDRKGRIAKTTRGKRSFRVAIYFADGSIYVSKRARGGMHMAAASAARLMKNVEAGLINRDCMRWDEDEHDMYVQYTTEGVRA